MQMQRVDVDKIFCKFVKARQLMDLCGSTVDICNAIPYLSDSVINIGCCIVQSPVYVFVAPDQKLPLVQAMRRQMGRFLICSEHPYKILDNTTPLKASTFDVVASLVSANIDTVTLLCFGQKMTVDAVRYVNIMTLIRVLSTIW